MSQPGRKGFWYQSQNPDDYNPMMSSEILRLAFPNSGAKNRSEMTSRALTALKDLADTGDVQIVTTGEGLIVMPPSKGSLSIKAESTSHTSENHVPNR